MRAADPVNAYTLLRPLLFALEPETAHALSLKALNYLPRACFALPSTKPVQTLGLEFPHALGLAAGFDKDGLYLSALQKLGFSHIELGTVTPKPQAGNPRPRIFRLPEASALINRMGFSNQGVQALVQRLKDKPYSGILGINIGKGRDTSLNQAYEDYNYCLEQVYPLASYITINISSPNTKDLRQLQSQAYLQDLLHQLVLQRQRLAQHFGYYRPMLVKLSPDETDAALQTMAEQIQQAGMDGIIISNTSASRAAVQGLLLATEQGGLSGAPLAARASECLRQIRQVVDANFCLIAVGGIDSAEAARERLAAGATLLQLYTGLVYQGPGLVKAIVAGL